MATFFRNDLIVDDWGKVQKPKDEGGRTTSVSVMKKSGVHKMGQGWLVLPNDEKYLRKFAERRVLNLQVDDMQVD